MYRKNTSGQFVCFQMLLTATGAIATGLSPAVRRCIDGTFAAGGGTVTEDTGTGGYKYAMAQADTNGNNISLFFTATGAIPVCINFITTAADPTDGVRLGLTGLANAVPGAAGGLFIAGTNAPVTISGSGDALTLASTGGNGNGLKAAGNGTGTGIDGNITGNITGNLSGSVGSLTGYIAPTNLTAAQIATGVWQDATAGDFTAADSIGKSVMNGVALGTGLTVNAVATGVALAAGQKVDVDTIKTNPVVNAGTITFPANATLASTTNLTSLTAAEVATLGRMIDGVALGTVANGASTSSVPTSALEFGGVAASGVVADEFKGRVIAFSGATTTAGLRGATATISANTASDTPTFTVGALPAVPVSGDTFAVI